MNWVTLIILIVASLGVGYFVAVLIGNNRREDQPEVHAIPDEVKGEDSHEIFRLLKRIDRRGVVPEIRGRTVETAADLSADEHAEISMGLVDLYTWLGESSRPAVSEEALAVAQAAVSEVRLGDSSQVASSPVSSTGEVSKSPSLNIFSSLRRTTQSEVKQKLAPPPASIAVQVDEILQGKLEARDLEGKAVRLLDLPNQGMVIMVGLEKYQDVADVPDEELRDLIKESVAEWTARMLKKE
jgi:hypothetical protein